MAPTNGTTSTPPKFPPNHSTLQWHPTMAPSNGTTSTPPKLVVNSPLHPHYNGNVQWHPAMAPRPLHPAMAPWCHLQSANGSKNPYSYRYLGKKILTQKNKFSDLFLEPAVELIQGSGASYRGPSVGKMCIRWFFKDPFKSIGTPCLSKQWKHFTYLFLL